MSALIRMPRAAWKRQPKGRCPLNPEWAYQARTSVFYSSWDFAQVQKYAGTCTIKTDDLGYVSVFNGSTDTKLLAASDMEIGAFTYLCRFMADAAPHALDYASVFGRHQQGELIWNHSITANQGAVQKINTALSWTVVPLQNRVGKPWITVALTFSGSTLRVFERGQAISTTSLTAGGDPYPLYLGRIAHSLGDSGSRFAGKIEYFYCWNRALSDSEIAALTENPYQIFAPAPARFYLIPSGGGAATYTAALSVDALIQRAGLTHSTHLDALLQSAFSKSLSLDSLIAAVQAQTISLDALLQIAGTRTITIDALLQATKSDVISIDALVQMTLAQSLSLDALIVAMGSASSSTNLDALIQSLKTAGISLDALLSTSAMQSVLLDALLQSSKTSFVSLDGLIQAAEMQTLSLDALVQAVQSGTLSLDALLSKSNIATTVIDALIQSSKTGAVSLDALITGASSASVFTGLDALIQAIQAKTISLDALLQKSYTSPLALDAYVALTQVKTMSLDALLQSTKSGVISLDAILQMTKTAMVSFDALIQAAKTGVISLDAILVFATQASILLDAYVQKTLARGVGLDAIIGAIADMILPTGRVITVPASDRFVFVTHSDRVIQIQ